MGLEEKSLIVDSLIELAKKSKLNSNQKKRILDMIESLDNATEIQKERFILYYGFNTNGRDFRNLTKIAKSYGCTVNAVRASVVSLRNKLSKLKKEFKIIEQVVNECKASKEDILYSD